jgi:hypothetical protein
MHVDSQRARTNDEVLMRKSETPLVRPAALLAVALAALTIAIAIWTFSSSREQTPDAISSAPDAVDIVSRSNAADERPAVPASRVAYAAKIPAEDSGASASGIQFLSVATRMPVSNESWLLSSAEPGSATSPIELHSDTDGRVALPTGSWRIDSRGSRWQPLQFRVEIGESEFAAVWVQRLSTRSFLFVSPSGAPLQGVDVQWLPRLPRGESPGSQAESRCTARSDDSGIASITDCACENGTAVCLHPDYERVLLSLCGKPDGVIRVPMSPALPPRALTFITGEERTAVTLVVLSSPDGYQVASSAAGSSEVQVPSWVLPDEPLLVESPATQPCMIRLGGLSGDEVQLPSSKRLSLRVQGDPRCPGDIRIALRQERSSDSTGVEALLPTHRLVLPSGVTRELSVPADSAIRVVATDACGNLADVRVAADVGMADLTLGRQTTARLAVRVIDPSGRPVSSASATTRLGSRVEADSSGRLSIPIPPEVRSFELSAQGFSTLTLDRSRSDFSSDGTGELTVTMQLVVSNRVLVQTVQAKLLSGMRVIAWQSTDESAVPPGSAWIVPRGAIAIEGTTGGDGQVLLHGLRVGEAKIEIRLPTELGTDRFQRSLYGTRRTPVQVNPDAFHSIEAPDAINVTLEVHSGVTGKPVRGFELRCARPDGPTIEVSGGVWQGWVAEDESPLVVIVDGLGSERLRLEPDSAGRRERVVVGRGSTAHVRLTGLPNGASNSVVDVMVMRSDSGGLEFDRSVRHRLDANESFEVVLGATAAPWIGIGSVTVGGDSFHFEPEFQAAQAGATLEFSATAASPR